MEQSFGADFSSVRVHTDSASVQMNKEINAQAFTHGSDIYFNEGKYDTTSSDGQKLLAHELTHTVQQGGSSIVPKVQKHEFGEQIRFDSIPGPPPRAIMMGPYRSEAIAEELYGDATVEVRYSPANPMIVMVDGIRLLDKWRPFFGPELSEEDEVLSQYTAEQRASAGVFALGTSLNNSAGAVEVIRNLYNNGITSTGCKNRRRLIIEKRCRAGRCSKTTSPTNL